MSPLGLTPLIQVFDMIKSIAFYRDILGFEVISASPEVQTAEGQFSHWMWLRLGAVDIMLNTQYDSNERPQQPDQARADAHGDVTLYLGCDDIESAYEYLTGRGLQADAPKLAPYGLKLFSVRDPDGYGIVFTEVRGGA